MVKTDSSDHSRNFGTFGEFLRLVVLLPLSESVELIANYKQPDTVHELRKFWGILTFYRKFLPKAAHIQARLYDFLKNSKKNDKRDIQWTAESINAFNQCNNQLANVTLLAHPSQDADLALMTGASDFGLGASLNEITSDMVSNL
ncbi:transposon Ty3-I Gag-Pol polyprotein [Trichonephila clavipes]|nr:transposon Ty3-I Gag-Pol polyprotein [Trichonephila clavipes]